MSRFDALDELVTAIGTASFKDREVLRDQLLALAQTFEDPTLVMAHLEQAKRSIQSLEARWEVDEVIEAITPPPPPAEPEPEEEQAPTGPLTAADLVLLYDDPRGIQVHKTKVGNRFLLTQLDPNTRRPQTFELRDEEVSQLKLQLHGSPYWIKQP